MNFDNMGVVAVCWAMRENMRGYLPCKVHWYIDTIHAAAEWLRMQKRDWPMSAFEADIVESVLGEYDVWARTHPKAAPTPEPSEFDIDRIIGERSAHRSNMLQGLLLRYARRAAGMSVRELADRLTSSVLSLNLLETGVATEVDRWGGGWDAIWGDVGRFGIERPVSQMRPDTSILNIPEDTEVFAIRRAHGADLRWARSRAGIMQEELGDLLGLTKAMVKMLEDGIADPPFGWDAMWSLMAHFEMPRPVMAGGAAG